MLKFSGNRLGNIRRNFGLSVQQVAMVIGVSRTTISFWEAGETTMKVNHLYALAKLFKVEMCYFFTKGGK